MSSHPSAHHEIALLRHEERLVRAALAHGHRSPADGVPRGRLTRDLDRLFEAVRARLGAQPGRAAVHVSRQPS